MKVMTVTSSIMAATFVGEAFVQKGFMAVAALFVGGMDGLHFTRLWVRLESA